jgi:membrane protease YdiL (CAAX protease family)
MTIPNAQSGIRRELAWFLALTFTASYAIAALAAARGGLAAFPALPLAMLMPMISAFIVQRFIVTEPVLSTLGFRVGRLRYWVVAPAAMLVMWITVFALSYVVHPAAYTNWSVIATRVQGLKNVPPTTLSAGGKLAVAYLLTLIIAPLLNLPIFLGEEVGWRAFMTPRLVALFGRPGLLIGGAIWGVWHTPFIYMGLNYPTHPLAGHLVWIPFCVAFGILLQTVYVRSRSIFPAALCHGLTNQFATLTLGLIVADTRFRELLDGPAGVVALLVLILPAAYYYRQFNTAPLTRGEPNQGTLAASVGASAANSAS